MSWSDTEADTLRRLWNAGESVTAICKRLRRNKNQIVGKAYRMNLPRKRPSARSKQPPGIHPAARPDPRAPVPPPPPPAYAPPKTCQWIDGDPAGEYSYCGAPVQMDRDGKPLPYCRGHAAKAYSHFDYVIGRDVK